LDSCNNTISIFNLEKESSSLSRLAVMGEKGEDMYMESNPEEKQMMIFTEGLKDTMKNKHHKSTFPVHLH